jgi:hypothetical protein
MSGFIRREFLQTISLAALASCIQCKVFIDKPNPLYPHYKKGDKWYYHDYKINVRRKDRNKIKNYNFFPQLHPLYPQGDIEVKDSKCKKLDAVKFVNRSISENNGISYVNWNLEKIIKEYKDGKVPKGDLDLAEHAINHFWKDISTDKGNGSYTLELECALTDTLKSSGEIKLKYTLPGDSRQTLAEFIGHYKKYKKYRGDCDDFAIALLSSYEIMRNISSKKKGHFWDKLYYGLQRKQVIYAVETSHAINFVLDYNQDFSKAIIRPLEPQKINPNR